MLSDKFIRIHNIKRVNIISEESSSPSIVIEFNDGRMYQEIATCKDFDNIVKEAKTIILKYSIFEKRKKKIKKLCGHITEEKVK